MDYNEVTLDKALETAMQLPPEQQDMLLDILQRRRIEARRREIAADAGDSLQAFRNGQFTTQSIGSILEELHISLEN
jgi:hypothetical protein